MNINAGVLTIVLISFISVNANPIDDKPYFKFFSKNIKYDDGKPPSTETSKPDDTVTTPAPKHSNTENNGLELVPNTPIVVPNPIEEDANTQNNRSKKSHIPPATLCFELRQTGHGCAPSYHSAPGYQSNPAPAYHAPTYHAPPSHVVYNQPAPSPSYESHGSPASHSSSNYPAPAPNADYSSSPAHGPSYNAPAHSPSKDPLILYVKPNYREAGELADASPVAVGWPIMIEDNGADEDTGMRSAGYGGSGYGDGPSYGGGSYGMPSYGSAYGSHDGGYGSHGGGYGSYGGGYGSHGGGYGQGILISCQPTLLSTGGKYGSQAYGASSAYQSSGKSADLYGPPSHISSDYGSSAQSSSSAYADASSHSADSSSNYAAPQPGPSYGSSASAQSSSYAQGGSGAYGIAPAHQPYESAPVKSYESAPAQSYGSASAQSYGSSSQGSSYATQNQQSASYSQAASQSGGYGHAAPIYHQAAPPSYGSAVHQAPIYAPPAQGYPQQKPVSYGAPAYAAPAPHPQIQSYAPPPHQIPYGGPSIHPNPHYGHPGHPGPYGQQGGHYGHPQPYGHYRESDIKEAHAKMSESSLKKVEVIDSKVNTDKIQESDKSMSTTTILPPHSEQQHRVNDEEMKKKLMNSEAKMAENSFNINNSPVDANGNSRMAGNEKMISNMGIKTASNLNSEMALMHNADLATNSNSMVVQRAYEQQNYYGGYA